MKNYLDKIKNYAVILKTASVWQSSGKSLDRLSNKTENDKDYVYEFFCYLAILKDLKENYDLEYFSGDGAYKHTFPKGPSTKFGKPFFYIKDRTSGKRLCQVCAGTNIEIVIKGNKAAPDISFQNPTASLKFPKFKDVYMIYDAKRNRGTKKKKLSKGQYSYFSTMIYELQINSGLLILSFKKFKKFNGNCLITNNESFKGESSYNKFHKLKEVEYFDHTLKSSKIKVIG